MSYAFVAAFLIMTASLVGIIFAWKSVNLWIEGNTHYLVSFSSGVFLVVVYNLLYESIEMGKNTLFILISAIAGAIFLEIISIFVSNSHHHHGLRCNHKHTHIDARRLLISDGIHNFVDGMLLVPAYLVGYQVGVATTIGIFLHELVQEASLFFILKEAKYSTASAIFISFMLSSTILLGVVAGNFISESSSYAADFIAFAAGAFLYVIFRDLVPSIIRNITGKKNMILHIASGSMGLLVMISVRFLASNNI